MVREMGIQIHLMLIFIISCCCGVSCVNAIQIHLMLIFIMR